jgi:hypothetical protein
MAMEDERKERKSLSLSCPASLGMQLMWKEMRWIEKIGRRVRT